MEKTPSKVCRNMASKVTFAAILAACSGQIIAQEGTGSDDSFVFEEIVVTAQKREQALSDVPISIRAFSSEELAKSNINDITDLAIYAPSMSIDESYLVTGTAVNIRGVGALGGYQPTFGIYLDGFELTGGNYSPVSNELADMQTIEVVRGPQGTTFGRNVVAGAINMTSKSPTGEIGGEVEGGFSNFGGYFVRGNMNLPIEQGVSGFRISGFYDHSDGNIQNINSIGGRNDYDKYGVRGAFESSLTENLTVNASVAYQRFDFGLPNAVQDGVLIGSAASLAGIINGGFGLVPVGSLPAGPDTYFPDQNSLVNYNRPSSSDYESFLSTLRLDYDFGNSRLVWVSGYIGTQFDREEDIDLGQFDTAYMEQERDSDFMSTELRLQSNGDEVLDWIFGVYLSKGSEDLIGLSYSGADMALLTNIPSFISGLSADLPVLPSNTLLVGSTQRTETTSQAIFGEMDYEFSEKLNILLGLRYNKDDVEASIEDGTDLASIGGPFLRPAPIPDDMRSDSFDKFTWRVSLQYEATDDVNLYGTVSTGYRAGGLQLNQPAKPSFGPESIINYEVGAKAFMFDRRASLNIAAFYMDWSDIQIATTNKSTNERYTDNAGKGVAKGVELDFTTSPVDGLGVSLGVAYIDTELKEFVDTTGLDRAGTPFPDAPKWTGSAVVDYQANMFGDIDGFIRASYIYNGEQLESLADGNISLLYLDAYERVDLRLGITKEDSWRLEGYIENLFDELYATGQSVSGFSTSGSYIISPPQRYGVRLTVQY